MMALAFGVGGDFDEDAAMIDWMANGERLATWRVCLVGWSKLYWSSRIEEGADADVDVDELSIIEGAERQDNCVSGVSKS